MTFDILLNMVILEGNLARHLGLGQAVNEFSAHLITTICSFQGYQGTQTLVLFEGLFLKCISHNRIPLVGEDE